MCENLNSITIPSSVTSIETGVFEVCYSLRDVYYNGTKEQWSAISVDDTEDRNDALHRAVIHFNEQEPAIYRINEDNVRLSVAKATYNGKAQTPAVIVKDNKGNVVAGTNYTVQYTDHTNVGQASVTVTFQGSYSGTVTKTFDIVPKGTKISKVTAKKKYYVRIRTYKTVNGKNYYSDWSAKKSVKTKK